MAKTVGIGIQDFGKIIEEDCFYIDKTAFIKEWWESKDEATLITRPRRFGKTLALNMTEYFFSVKYAGRGELFEGLSVWQEEKYRCLQGTYPVISLSFAGIKEGDYKSVRQKICQILADAYTDHKYLLESDALEEEEKTFFRKVSADMDDVTASLSLQKLSKYLNSYYGKKAIILLDEYDTPMQEAYVCGYWRELTGFIRNLFNSTFKTNKFLGRSLMTGITRVGKESIFSDLNNLKVVTTVSNEYADSFGFTEAEVFASLDVFGMSADRQEVKQWYDGFTFGNRNDIYNPWSIINYLDTGEFKPYWANTSSNKLAGTLIQEGDKSTKQNFETLLQGGTLTAAIDEQIVYDQLNRKRGAVWSFLLAAGYLKVVRTEFRERTGRFYYTLALTNKEVRMMFEDLIRDWFGGGDDYYNDFIRAFLCNDIKAMNLYMNKVALATFSYFDTGRGPLGAEPERFYHGFVLGLMVELKDRYIITSNRESGFGRYDVVLEPREQDDAAMILEFKVQDKEDEKDLLETASAALAQIEEKNYDAALIERGISQERIRKYGFAFCGKKVLIRTAKED